MLAFLAFIRQRLQAFQAQRMNQSIRIIGGSLKGRKVSVAQHPQLRPTGARQREALFNMLQHQRGFAGLRVLDLFAGSGILGIEALSRGAAYACFVEQALPVIKQLRRNLQQLDLTSCSSCHQYPLPRGLERLHQLQNMDVVFMDPPYHGNLAPACLSLLAQAPWWRPQGLLALEVPKDRDIAAPKPFTFQCQKIYGHTKLCLWQFEGPGSLSQAEIHKHAPKPL